MADIFPFHANDFRKFISDLRVSEREKSHLIVHHQNEEVKFQFRRQNLDSGNNVSLGLPLMEWSKDAFREVKNLSDGRYYSSTIKDRVSIDWACNLAHLDAKQLLIVSIPFDDESSEKEVFCFFLDMTKALGISEDRFDNELI